MASTAAVAYEAGDILVKGGLAHVSPNDDSSRLSSPYSGAGVEVGEDTQVGLTLTYMYTDNIGIELLAATPFKHQITGTLGLAEAPVADTTHLPPTVTVNYYPEMADSPFQPYVGAGINYTNFLDTQSHLTNTNVDLDSSWGLAAHAGVDYAITENWSLNAAVWYIDLSTTATLSSIGAGGLDSTVDVDIDPTVYMVGVSYKF